MAYTTTQNLYAADVTIAAGGTYAVDSSVYDVSDVETVALQLRATGDNTASAGTVQAKIVARVNDAFSTEIPITVSVTLNGNNQVVSAPVMMDVRGVSAIKVVEITNGDATYGVSGVNVAVGKTLV